MNSTSNSGHSATIEAIYRAILEPDGWIEPLDRLATEMNACSGIILAIDTRHAEVGISNYSSHFTPILKELDYWRQNYSHHDDIAYRNLFAMPTTGFRCSIELTETATEANHRANPSVAYGIEHFGFEHRAATRLSTHGAWLDMLAVQFANGRCAATPQEMAAGARFIPHFAQAVELVRAFQILRARYQAVIGALDHLRTGIVIVLGESEVVIANRSAREMTEVKDGLFQDPRGRLRAWHNSDSQGLDGAIRRSSSTAAGRGDSSRTLLTVQRRSGGTPYLVTVSPLADDGAELDPRFRGAVVTVIDPDDRSVVSTTGLRQLYGLTPAEAEIARLLAQGLRPDAIANMRGTSIQTVRTQVKAVLSKTNASSRTDLVRLAVLVDMPIDDPGGAVGS